MYIHWNSKSNSYVTKRLRKGTRVITLYINARETMRDYDLKNEIPLTKPRSLLRPKMCVLKWRIFSTSLHFLSESLLKLPLIIKNFTLSLEWLALLKWLATGKPVKLPRMLHRWLLNLNLNLDLVSPMYTALGHLSQYIA